jgi:hypothetical protein
MSPDCRSLWRSLLVVAVFGLGGCRASYVDRGAALYANHNYVEADELFEHNEGRLKTASSSERARYALYRGVTLLSLGDSSRARFWLGYASRCADRDSEALSEEERATLDRALETHAKYEARIAEHRNSQNASASLEKAPSAQ